MSGSGEASPSRAQLRNLLSSRSIGHVVVLGANGTMGYGSGALFTQAVPRVSFLARSREKAQRGLAAAIGQVRSPTVASRVDTGDYERDFESTVSQADLVFEALTEDFDLKRDMFDRVERTRRDDSIVATVTSGISINSLSEGRGDSFRRNFLGLHLFNPPNVMVGTELIPGRDTDPGVVDFVDAFARFRLGREIIRTSDTSAFAGNRVGFKVLNEAAQLAEELGPVLVDRIIGPYTGRALTPLATIDLVGWDVHKAIVDGVYESTRDEAHETLRLPTYMNKLIERGVLGDKTGGGFFETDDETRLALDPASGDYKPEAEIAVPGLGYIDDVSTLYRQARYAEGMRLFLAADGEEAAIARRVVAGYISYAFQRVGEVTESINGIDRIMATGFNWAPPSLLVDTMGAPAAVELIEKAELSVPDALLQAARTGEPKRFFHHATLNPGKYFVAG